MEDEWDLLEKQLEAGGAATNVGAPEPKAGGKESRKRSRSRERRHRSRSKDKKERDRERRRSRSRDRDGRRRSNRDDRDFRDDRRERRRSRSRDRRERGKEGGRDRSRSGLGHLPREGTPPEVRLAREKERELKELERSVRTIFVYNVNIKAEEPDIFEFFHQAGDINDIRIITDRHTKRSKGLAYIEFANQESIYKALALSGQPLMGQAVMVKTAEAEKNLAWEAQQAAKQNQTEAASILTAALGATGVVSASQPCRLQVNGFAPGLGEEQLKQIFEPFGSIEKVELVRDAAGSPVGYGYVTFKNITEGMNAKNHWNGKQLLNNTLSVVVAPLAGEAALMEVAPSQPAAPDIDDDEGGGLKLSTQARAALMSRLAGSAGLPVPPVALPGPPPLPPPPPMSQADQALALEQGVLGPPSPIPTPCLLLKNMFDPAEAEGNPGFEQELISDVTDEAGKFGTVLHCHADLVNKAKPFVYLKFSTTEAAQAAHKALNGRFYGGKPIMVEFQFAQVYNTHFGL